MTRDDQQDKLLAMLADALTMLAERITTLEMYMFSDLEEDELPQA